MREVGVGAFVVVVVVQERAAGACKHTTTTRFLVTATLSQPPFWDAAADVSSCTVARFGTSRLTSARIRTVRDRAARAPHRPARRKVSESLLLSATPCSPYLFSDPSSLSSLLSFRPLWLTNLQSSSCISQGESVLHCCADLLTPFQTFAMVNLRSQKRLAASVAGVGKRKIWLDPAETVSLSTMSRALWDGGGNLASVGELMARSEGGPHDG